MLKPFLAYVDFVEDLRVRSGEIRRSGKEALRSAVIHLASIYIVSSVLAVIATRIMPSYGIIATALSISLPPAIYIIAMYLKAYDYASHLISELEYFIISLGLSQGTDVELGRDIMELGESWRRYALAIFPALTKFSDRLAALATVFGVLESLRMVGEKVSKKLKRLISEYLTAYSMGLGGMWIADSLNYYTRVLKERAREAVKLRIAFSVAISAVIGYVPPIASLMSNLIGTSAISYAAMLMLILIPVGVVSLPKIPRHMTELQCRRNATVQKALFISGITLLAVGVALLDKTILLASGVALIASGVIWLKELMDALRELYSLNRIIKAISEMPLLTVGNINRLRTYLKHIGGTLSNFPRGDCSEYHYWITCFADFTISNLFSRGDVKRETLMLLKDVIENMITDIRRLIITGIGLSIVAIGISTLMISTTYLLISVNDILVRYIIMSSTALGFFVSKAGFNKLSTGLVPGISLIILLGGGVF